MSKVRRGHTKLPPSDLPLHERDISQRSTTPNTHEYRYVFKDIDDMRRTGSAEEGTGGGSASTASAGGGGSSGGGALFSTPNKKSFRNLLDITELPSTTLDPIYLGNLIKRYIDLDSVNVDKNLGTFCNTSMCKTANSIIEACLPYNYANKNSYTTIIKIEQTCIRIIAALFCKDLNIRKNITGTSTVGSSEAILIAGILMINKWQKKQGSNSPSAKPNIILPSLAHITWKRFCQLFSVEPRYIDISYETNYSLLAERILEKVNSNTIGVCAILGNTFTGHYDPIHEINDLLVKYDNTYQVPIHVDAALGGFIAPFNRLNYIWGFDLERVESVNVSGHKYGFVYPGIGWLLFREQNTLYEDSNLEIDYLEGNTSNININFSRPSAFIIAQFYQFMQLGSSGYLRIIKSS